MNTMNVSVIVPVYFNEQSLALLFAELVKVEQALQARGLGMELIFVDDGSGDQSLRELLAIKAQRPATCIVKLARNFGAIHAIKTGLQFVTGDCFVFLAADLQDPPELIVEMAERWQAGSKYVICARSDRQDPASSKIFSGFYYWLLRWLVVPNYPQGGYDLALMDRVMLSHLRESGKNINVPLFAYWLGFKPDVIHYTRRERQHGKSRWTFSKKLKFFLDSILGFSIIPIRIISLIGIVVSLASFAYGVWIAVNVLIGNPEISEVRGFPTLVSLISFLLGLVIIMLGIIGEYIWRIFDEINKRPESVIEQVF
jgi:polyisoprenyl-phosphate glycosyltransferase